MILIMPITPTTAAADLQVRRTSLGLSQSKLARLSTVSRFKICMFELGGGNLTVLELSHLNAAFEGEAARLRDVVSRLNVSEAK